MTETLKRPERVTERGRDAIEGARLHQAWLDLNEADRYAKRAQWQLERARLVDQMYETDRRRLIARIKRTRTAMSEAMEVVTEIIQKIKDDAEDQNG